MAKKENNQRNHRSYEAWQERKHASNSTPERKERQRAYRLEAIVKGVVLTDKRAAEYNRLNGGN